MKHEMGTESVDRAVCGVSAPLPEAVDAGKLMLLRGGSAVDAAISANAVLAVAFPHMCGLGGDAFAVIRTCDGQEIAINGSGKSAVQGPFVDPTLSHDDRLKSPSSITVPGTVGAWAAMHAKFGKLRWGELLEPAISLAHDGFSVSEHLALAVRANLKRLVCPRGEDIPFMRKGKPVETGEMVNQPALAKTLNTLKFHGPAEFYRGKLAAEMTQFFESSGVPLKASDLETFEPLADKAYSITLEYRGGTVKLSTTLPNSQGVLILAILSAVLRQDSACYSSLDEGNVVHLAESALRLDAWRSAHLADPDDFTVAISDALFESPNEHIANRLKDRSSLLNGTGDTAAISVVDSQGNAVSLIQSIFTAFGTGIYHRELGIFYHNRGAALPIQPNGRLLEARRPPHSLSPLIVEFSTGEIMAIGTMGGWGQPQIIAQFILNYINSQATLDEINLLPRWIIEPRNGKNGPPQVVSEESAWPKIERAMGQLGIERRLVDPSDDLFGHLMVVSRNAGNIVTSIDPRASLFKNSSPGSR